MAQAVGDAGKRARLTSCLEQHEAALTHFAARMLGDVEKARDVVQETFLRLWKVPGPATAEATAPWLYTVCRNLAIDVLRKEKRLVSLTRPDELPSSAPEAGESAEQQEGVSRVLAALSGLPKNQQEVLRLKFQSGLSYKDISQVTGHSVTNVGFLIHRGVKALRGALAGEAGDAKAPRTKGGAP